MKAAALRDNEAATLATLHGLAVLDSAADPEFDALAQAAATICCAPIALISLIDEKRQWFKANVGLHEACETPREIAFCAHAVRGDDIFEVPDARNDERFADNPLVTGAPSIRFYAGAPVKVNDAHRIGTVCVIDRQPRRLTPVQRDVLRQLAIAVGKALEGRAASLKLREQMAAPSARQRQLHRVTDSVPSLMSYWDADLRCRYANGAHQSWFGTPAESLVGRRLDDVLGPALHARYQADFERGLAGERIEREYSARSPGGRRRETLVHLVPDVVGGRVVGVLVQVTDVTPLKTAARELEREKAEMQRIIRLQDQTTRALNDAQRLGDIGSWEADLVTGHAVWSQQIHRIMGSDPSEPPLPWDERSSPCLPESAERLRQAWARCAQDGEPYVLELELLRREDGEPRWVEARGDAVREGGDGGRIIGMRGTLQDITDRKRLARELADRNELARRALQQLRQVTDNLPALIAYLDADERFRFANQLFATWLGHDPLQLVGVSLIELYGQDTYDVFKHHIRRALGGARVDYARKLDTLLGMRHVEVSLVPDVNAAGSVEGLFMMMVDATARHQAEAALQHSEHRLRLAADNIPALVTYLDQDERYRFVNEHHGDVFQIEPSALLGRRLRDVVDADLYRQIAPQVAAALRGEQVTFEGQWSVRGSPCHFQSTYIPDTGENGQVQGFYAMTFDITALKETQGRLDALARIDSLTGLPNRRHFDERLPEAMARARRTGAAISLMFLDVDRFKQINDSLGHGMGDEVLKEFALRLRRQVRNTDLVARLAGDEFVMLLEGVHHADEMEALAEKVVRAIRPPMVLSDGSLIEVTTSVGVALYDGDDRPAELLLAAADRALYKTKHAGRDGYSLSTEGVSTLCAELDAEGSMPSRAAPGVQR